MSNRNSKFQRGTGVYQCEACKRSTRATGGDNHQVGLCEECYEIAGLENAINDHGDQNGHHAIDIAILKQRCIEKGGKL